MGKTATSGGAERGFQSIPESTTYPSLEVIKGAGHMPTLEQPGETIYALMRWLEDENG